MRADAEAALATLARLQEAAEVERLSAMSNIKQFDEGRTTFQGKRDKAKYISLFGIEKFTSLVRDSR